MSSIQELRENLPHFAKDTKLNIAQVLKEDYSLGLSEKQIFTTALSCAYAIDDKAIAEAILNDAKEILGDEDVVAAKAAASLMAMNNVYYRFLHLSEDKNLSQRPAQLRMNFMAQPGVSKLDFEIYSLAVSVLSGCGMCIKSHINSIKKHGLNEDAIQSTARIAAVVNALSTSLKIGN